MAAQIVSAAKRYRVSLLLDTYGDLLTAKQRTFLRHYYEEDLSFGEIAREYKVSRQAIFDSVKHGEESLEAYEQSLRLVESGWLEWSAIRLPPQALADRLRRVIGSLAEADGRANEAIRELDALIGELGAERTEPPALQAQARG